MAYLVKTGLVASCLLSGTGLFSGQLGYDMPKNENISFFCTQWKKHRGQDSKALKLNSGIFYVLNKSLKPLSRWHSLNWNECVCLQMKNEHKICITIGALWMLVDQPNLLDAAWGLIIQNSCLTVSITKKYPQLRVVNRFIIA